MHGRSVPPPFPYHTWESPHIELSFPSLKVMLHQIVRGPPK